MRLKQYFKNISYMGLACVLSACSNSIGPTQEQFDKDMSQAEAYSKVSEKIKPQSLIKHTNDIFIAEKSFPIENKAVLPPVFHQHIIYASGRAESVPNIMSEIFRQTGVSFRFTPDAIDYLTGAGGSVTKTTSVSGERAAGALVKTEEVAIGEATIGSNVGLLSQVQMNLQYEGTLEELINQIATQFNVHWEYNSRQGRPTVTMYHLKTQTFPLDVLPGATTFSSALTSATSTTSGSEGTSSLQGGSNMTVSYTNDKGNAWQDTYNTIEHMMSAYGRISGNPRAGYVSVTDTPEVLSKISNYVHKINERAKKKIAVRVDVYDVEVDATTNYGLQWSAMFDAIGADVVVNTANSASTALTPETLTNTVSMTFSGDDSASIIFKALQTLGNASVVNGTTVYTVNGEPAPVQVIERSDYLKEIQTTVDQGVSETSVTPGSVITGYFMVVTPKILSDNQILLNLSLSLSSLVRFEKQIIGATSLPEGQDSTDVPLSDGTTLQFPVVRSKNFMESVTLNPGQTVVLAGFQQDRNAVDTSSIGPIEAWPLGGAKSADSTKTITVTVVTPYIIGR